MNKNSKEFLALKTKWYKKLDQSGFDDIEQDDDHLKRWHSRFFSSKYPTAVFEAKQEYYRLAVHFYGTYKFDSDEEKTIWTLHANGKSIREIILALKEKNIHSYKNKVHGTIQKIAAIMLNKRQGQK